MPAGTSDYYQTLGVERTATADEIKKAFRRKARELHPDVNKAADAEDRFKEINEAYDALSDPAKRQQYDTYGSVGGRAPGGGGGYGGGYVDLNDLFGGGGAGGFDMGDLFSAFFGGVSGGGRGVRLEGRDMAMSLTVTLEEAATGAEKEIVLDHLAPCDVCDGTGAAEGSSVATCPDCNGSGQRVQVRRTFIGQMQTVGPCERCSSTGHIVEQPCEECQGSGRVPDRQHVNVNVPAGISDGQQIRLRGMGEAGIRGATPGDLLVAIRIAPHDFIHREGNELHCKANVSISQAALGAELSVCGLLEDNKVHIPSGTQHGDTVRLKGRGMPRMGGGGSRGDLIVHVGVQVPKKLSKRQKELLRELGDELGDAKSAEKSTLEKLKDWLRG
ncbi:MAG: molecular chaperone DnaJ [Actinobacteria bacterium HGW-Actinobacteria-7]|nr:MAG: molecular chaperone DnaJ [Actinobacteria bacterium HGW-Actinobacteria-7]